MNQNWINQNKKPYEPPTAKIYRFDAKEQILTSSGQVSSGTETGYAANELNLILAGTNTTFEG